MAVNITENYTWTNEHSNVTRSGVTRYEISNDAGAANWQSGFAGIQSMLRTAASDRKRVRAYGGRWSLSDAAVSNDIVMNSKPLTYLAPVGSASVVGPALYAPDAPLAGRLFYVQCGAQIMQLNRLFEARGLSLPTTGASNGQTIVGAVSTGTHGSALNVGSMQDFVRAVHLVTSSATHYLIQPSTAPALGASFAAALGAELVQSDEIFYSAVVSFGSFGIVHALVVETVPLFTLEVHCERMSLPGVQPLFPLLSAYNANDPALIGELRQFLSRFGHTSTGELHHVDVIVNPYSDTDNAYIRAMFGLAYDANALSPERPDGTRVGDDIITLVGSVGNVAGAAIPALTSLFFSRVAAVGHGYRQTPRNIFGDSTIYRNTQGATSIEFGVAVADAWNAIALISEAMQNDPIAGVIGVRFVRPTSATLGFTRFGPLTCTIEIPAINTLSVDRCYRAMCHALDDAGIVFTLHWGQEGDYSPMRLSRMYGARLDVWNRARAQMLPDAAQRYMFTNDFQKRCGIDTPMPLQPGGAIA